MDDKAYVIRPMSRSEIDIAIEWAAIEGWNPGLYDAGCFYAADPQGFLIGLLDGKPVATISAVRYGDSFGFLGFYIVKPEFRGMGYGLRMWGAALRHLEGRNIGLDGVIDQQENYKKSGFLKAYRNIRYEGMSGGILPRVPEIVPLSSFPFEAVDEYDRLSFPANRTTFLEHWLRQPESISFCFLYKRRIAGYGMIRVCRRGYKIGPLFANNSEIAEMLFVALKAGVEPGQPVYLDVPQLNSDAIDLAKRHGMNSVFSTARMYAKANPDVPLSRVFGVTSFELG